VTAARQAVFAWHGRGAASVLDQLAAYDLANFNAAHHALYVIVSAYREHSSASTIAGIRIGRARLAFQDRHCSWANNGISGTTRPARFWGRLVTSDEVMSDA
jgi:hypothetical protein